ncbi:MAG: glycolate oxidase [Bacteriovoracaceae bacterium]|jgi:glycolate oxidase
MIDFYSMALISKTFKNTAEVSGHLCTSTPTFYHTSRTSTVVPYEILEKALGAEDRDVVVGDLSVIKPEMSLNAKEQLIVRGAVTWKDAKEFCLANGREVGTSPTEELAGVLSGLATSCTGERAFGFGTLRNQVVECKYLDHEGKERVLSRDKDLKDHSFFKDEGALLESYQLGFAQYSKYKNAPFPRMQVETDLMIGTEGQLGVITEATLETTPKAEVIYLFLMLPKWEVDYSNHLEIYHAVQSYRDKIYACELIDENSLSYLEKGDRPAIGKDLIFLEIDSKYFEDIYESFLSKINLPEEDIFEIAANKCRQLRMNIPRAIFEVNSKMGVTKKGTDVQVSPERFKDLMDYYRGFSKGDVPYNLFGHFGDAHLHFNFMPKPEENEYCQELLEGLYSAVKGWCGSPFAEHGIGIIKQKFIGEYFKDPQYKLFSFLKGQMDPKNVLFPQGFMNMEKTN